MPNNRVYSFDYNQHEVPPGFTFTRASEAYELSSEGTYFVKKTNDQPRFETKGLLIEPASTNYVTYSQPNSTESYWSGKSYFKFDSYYKKDKKAQPLMLFGNNAVVLHGLGNENDPYLTAADTGTAMVQITFGMLIELIDVERVGLGFRDSGTFTWTELIEIKVADGSTYQTIGTETKVTSQFMSSGPNGGKVYKLEIRMPRSGKDMAIAPIGAYSNHLTALVHHVQQEEQPWFTSPIVTTGTTVTRAEERLDATIESLQLPTFLSIEANTSTGTNKDQVLWQLDDNTDNNVIRLYRKGDSSFLFEVIISGASTYSKVISSGINNDSIFKIAIAIESNLTFRWSLDGATEQTDTITSLPSVTRERLCCAAGSDKSWSGWLRYADRWNDN